MKIAVTADPHLNNNSYHIQDSDSGLYIKSIDAIRAFEWFGDEAINRKVDRIVVVGDVYHHPDTTELIRTRLNKVLQKLAGEGIQVVIMAGNHDFCSRYHALQSLVGWNKHIKILDKPFVETGVATYVPHTMDIECERTDFREVIKGLPTADSKNHVFFGHFAVRGALRDNLSREESGNAVSATDIEGTGATVAFLGHFHKYQRIKGNIPIFYTGSIENHRMDDMDGKRGFFIYDTDTGEYERVDYENCRPMHSIEVEDFDSAMLILRDGDWESSIVRLSAVGEHSDYLDIRNKMMELKRLFSAAGGAYIFCRDKTAAVDPKGSKIEIESIEKINVLETLKAEIDERIPDDEECSLTKDLLEEVHAEEKSK